MNLPESAVRLLRDLSGRQTGSRRMFDFDYRADLNLVFCHANGNHILPGTIAKPRRVAKKAGLKGVSFHTIRHSPGSQQLRLGVPLPTVSKRLGHLNTHVTATICSHALPQDEIAAAQL